MLHRANRKAKTDDKVERHLQQSSRSMRQEQKLIVPVHYYCSMYDKLDEQAHSTSHGFMSPNSSHVPLRTKLGFFGATATLPRDLCASPENVGIGNTTCRALDSVHQR